MQTVIKPIHLRISVRKRVKLVTDSVGLNITKHCLEAAISFKIYENKHKVNQLYVFRKHEYFGLHRILGTVRIRSAVSAALQNQTIEKHAHVGLGILRRFWRISLLCDFNKSVCGERP